jgi:non-heme chloroperoxidase
VCAGVNDYSDSSSTRCEPWTATRVTIAAAEQRLPARVATHRQCAKVSQGLRDSFWLQGMWAGFKGVIDCIKAFSETDHTEDLKRFDVPMLIIHGDDDQIVPIGASALLSSKIVKGSTLRIYPGAPHGCLCSTHKDQVNADLLAFLKT